jgi:hypothetical protein
MRYGLGMILFCVTALFNGVTLAQDVSVSELKAKGAKVLSADELKNVLSGAQVRYENAQYQTQMKLNSDGTLNGRSESTAGASSATRDLGYDGEWTITDGRWCGVTRRRGAELSKYCRDVLKLNDAYYYAEGNRKDDRRRATKMSISK